MSLAALCALGAPVAAAQSVVLWQPLQSTPPVSGCVNLALGSTANGLPTSWQAAQLLVMAAWSKSTCWWCGRDSSPELS